MKPSPLRRIYMQNHTLIYDIQKCVYLLPTYWSVGKKIKNEKQKRYKGIMPAGYDKKPKGSYLFD